MRGPATRRVAPAPSVSSSQHRREWRCSDRSTTASRRRRRRSPRAAGRHPPQGRHTHTFGIREHRLDDALGARRGGPMVQNLHERSVPPTGVPIRERGRARPWEHDMMATTHLVHAIAVADALIETHGQDGTEWLKCRGRAKIERGVAGRRAAPGLTGPRTSSSCGRFGMWSTPWSSLATRASSPASTRSSTRTGTDGGTAQRRRLGRSACRMFNAALRLLSVRWRCAGASCGRCSCRGS